MDQEFDGEGGDGQSPPSTYSSLPSARTGDRELSSAHYDVGDQAGLSYRAPSFGSDGLMSRTRDYLGVSPLQYSTDEFSQGFMSIGSDAVTSAAAKYAVSTSYSLAVSGQIGLFPYPILGAGPYAGLSITGGYTSGGDAFVQVQGSVGGGIGSFYSYGTAETITGHGSVTEGLHTSDRLEVNAGLGPKFLTVSVNRDLEVTGTPSGLLGSKLSFGQTEGLGAAYVYSASYTVKNPEVAIRKAWDQFALSVGRDIHEFEIQLYAWSRMMQQ